MKRPKTYFQLLACLLVICLLVSAPKTPTDQGPQTSIETVQQSPGQDTEPDETTEPSTGRVIAACIIILLAVIIVASILSSVSTDDEKDHPESDRKSVV